MAATAALMVPGLGHLYNGKVRQAVAWALGFLASAILFMLLLTSDAISREGIFLFLFVGIFLHFFHACLAGWVAASQGEAFATRAYIHWPYYIMWWLTLVLLVFFSALLIGNYRSFKTPSTSMESALLLDEWFIADMAAYKRHGPERGQAVIFTCPCDGTTLYFKRCMGVPGDTIQIIDKKLYINGALAQEPPTVQFLDTTVTGELRIHPKLSGKVDSRDNYGPHEVPPGHFFLIGDSRDNSYDSRYFGFVPHKMILGRAIRIYSSPDWTRIGKLIR